MVLITAYNSYVRDVNIQEKQYLPKEILLKNYGFLGKGSEQYRQQLVCCLSVGFFWAAFSKVS